MLKKYKVGWVIADSGDRWASSEIVTARHIYLRFHGPDGVMLLLIPKKCCAPMPENAGDGWRKVTICGYFSIMMCMGMLLLMHADCAILSVEPEYPRIFIGSAGDEITKHYSGQLAEDNSIAAEAKPEVDIIAERRRPDIRQTVLRGSKTTGPIKVRFETNMRE